MNKIYYIPTNKKIISLTFDDGPCDPTTLIILQILKEFNIKSDFFVLAENARHNPRIIKKILNYGHSIHLHSYEHTSFSNYSKRASYICIKRSINVLNKLGVKPIYFRPPYGTLPLFAEPVIQQFNLISIGWTIMEDDWKSLYMNMKAADTVSRTSPGSIIIMHDGYRHMQHRGVTVGMLKKVIPKLIKKGYSFVSISELIANENKTQVKIFNGVPLLNYHIAHLVQLTTLFLYWDVNLADCSKTFEIKIKHIDNQWENMILNYPSPNAMNQWSQEIDFPSGTISNNTEIWIKNNNQFVKLI